MLIGMHDKKIDHEMTFSCHFCRRWWPQQTVWMPSVCCRTWLPCRMTAAASLTLPASASPPQIMPTLPACKPGTARLSWHNLRYTSCLHCALALAVLHCIDCIQPSMGHMCCCSLFGLACCWVCDAYQTWCQLCSVLWSYNCMQWSVQPGWLAGPHKG